MRFSESRASSVETLVEGSSFYPRMLEDIASASSSVHINQFGFRPGVVGDAFATTLIAKAAEGVPSGSSSIAQGSRPRARAAGALRTSTSAQASRCASSARRNPACSSAPSAAAAAKRWNLGGLAHIDHRKVVVVDGGIGWVGGAGIEDHFQDGRFHDLFVRVTGPVVAQLQLVFVASFRWLGGAIPSTSSTSSSRRWRRAETPFLRSSSTTPRRVPADHRRDRAPARERRETLDVVNPYVTDRGMIRRIEGAARRGVRVRLFVPANATTGPARPRSNFTTRRSWTPAFASSSTRRCCTRRRSCATVRRCSRARAISRRGA